MWDYSSLIADVSKPVENIIMLALFHDIKVLYQGLIVHYGVS